MLRKCWQEKPGQLRQLRELIAGTSTRPIPGEVDLASVKSDSSDI